MSAPPAGVFTPVFIVLRLAAVLVREPVLAKPNYSFEKRQRDLEKKRKQEEKRLRKLAAKKPGDGPATEADDDVQGSPDAPSAEAAGSPEAD